MDVYMSPEEPGSSPAVWVPHYLQLGRTDTFPCEQGAPSGTLDFPGALPAIRGLLNLEDGQALASCG